MIISKNVHRWFSKNLPEFWTDLPQRAPFPRGTPVDGGFFALLVLLLLLRFIKCDVFREA